MIALSLDLSTPLRYGRDDIGLREWLSPSLSFRPEKSLDFGAEKSFLFSALRLPSWEFYFPFRLSECNGAHGEICF